MIPGVLKPSQQQIALVDCNNFYVSCERVFNPALIGKPVIVLSKVISGKEDTQEIKIKE